MDDMTIEEHKKMMIGETIPLFENAGVSPDEAEFSFEVKRMGGYAIIEMTVFRNGVSYLSKSRKVEQLNG